MKTVILSGGKAPSLKLLESELRDASNLIGVDSGGNFLRESGIVPDYLVGDFDSIEIESLEYFKDTKCRILEYPKDKDFTDTELALELAVRLESNQIVFLGSTGTRLDHVLGNMGLLKTCVKNGIEAFIKDENNSIMMTDKPLTINAEPGTTFSLQAFSGAVENLTLSNARYPLNNYKLEIGDPLTISNKFLENTVDIMFTKGLLMIMYSRD
ncbi:MAG: thiamine diphosphokinase [Clostridiaceae bacterium]